jgi:hypothetical protein
VNTDLSEEALAYAASARRAIESAGGDRLLLAAEENPGCRESQYAPVLERLGAWELDPRGDRDDLEAAAALCRAAGYWGVAYPVAERLARPRDLDVDGLVVVPDRGPAVAPVAGLPLRWAAVSVSGRRSLVTRARASGPPRTAAFAATLDLANTDLANTDLADADLADGAGDVALGLVLPCWTLLGMLDRAIELAVSHVRVREQFGQPLAAFQGVQFQLTEAEVERSGLDVLAAYALWSIQTGNQEATRDALALRMAALEAAEVVFRVAHQLHGAMGFCDETPLSWLSRYSQPIRRAPLGLSATRALLSQRIGRHGLTGLFSD